MFGDGHLPSAFRYEIDEGHRVAHGGYHAILRADGFQPCESRPVGAEEDMGAVIEAAEAVICLDRAAAPARLGRGLVDNNVVVVALTRCERGGKTGQAGTGNMNCQRRVRARQLARNRRERRGVAVGDRNHMARRRRKAMSRRASIIAA